MLFYSLCDFVLLYCTLFSLSKLFYPYSRFIRFNIFLCVLCLSSFSYSFWSSIYSGWSAPFFYLSLTYFTLLFYCTPLFLFPYFCNRIKHSSARTSDSNIDLSSLLLSVPSISLNILFTPIPLAEPNSNRVHQCRL